MKFPGYKLLILVCATIFSLFCGEYILRIFHVYTPDSLRTAPYTFSCYQTGAYFWLRYRPDSSCVLHSTISAFPDVPFSFNHLGLRGSEIQIPKLPNTHRILFVGDSFITGWGVSEKDALPQLTGEILRATTPGKDIETINAGLSASGPGYSYIYLRHEQVKLNPDVIVVGLYIHNDIADTIRESEWNDLDEDGLPTAIGSTVSYVDYLGNIRRNTGSIKLLVPSLRRSYVYDLLTDGFIRILPKKYTDQDRVDLSCLFIQSCHTYDEQKERMKQLFLGMQSLADQTGKKLLVFLIPSELQVHPEHSKRYGIQAVLTAADVSRPNREFISYFQEHGIDSLDLLPLFQTHADVALYFPLDEHWTVRGNHIAAQAIADHIRQMIQ